MTKITDDNAYRLDADGWLPLLSGLKPSDEEIFLQRLADQSVKNINELREQWNKIDDDAGASRAILRIRRFFNSKT